MSLLINPYRFATATGTVTYVQATNNHPTATTSPVVPKPTGAATGNLLVAFYHSRGVTTFTPPAGWTTLVEIDSAGGGDAISGSTLHCFTRVVQGGDPTSWTGTSSDSRAYGVGVIELAGAHATPITAYSTNAAQTSSTLTFTGITVPSNNSILIGAASDVAVTTDVPATTTERYDLGSPAGSQASGNAFTKAVNAGATGNLTASTSHASPSGWATILLAVNPA